MQKNVLFQLEEAIEIPNWADAYPQHKFTVAKCCFLSTRQNSHGIIISKEVLKKYAPTILGNFLVAKIEYGDATTHKDTEIPYGYFPKEQEVEFIEDGEILKAYAYAVISKRYSKEFNGIFEFDNLRDSSVEMTIVYEKDSDDTAESLDIYGLTCLGKTVHGSCPDADIKLVRFSKNTAEKYFAKNDGLSVLKQFIQERNQSMAGKKYAINKSKEALSNDDWGGIDKTDLRNKIMEAENRDELVGAVYGLVEDGWEESPSEHLKYPLMQFKGDTLVYNRGALSSALAYAKQYGETAVIEKVEKIYKSLDLDDSERKEEKEMDENISLSEEEVKVEEEEAKELAEPEENNTETEAKEEKLTEDEQTEEDEDAKEEKEEETEMSSEEMMSKIAELEKQVEEKENIIMDKDKTLAEKDAELESLKTFKAEVEAKEQATAVEKILSEVAKFMDKATVEEYRKEGLTIEFAQLDGWANKVKASALDKVVKNDKGDGVFKFASPVEKSKSGNVWDRL